MENNKLKSLAYKRRADVLEMVSTPHSGHPGGALGMADVITTLHYNFLRDEPDKPTWEDRDRFILSNGHTCALLYSILADKGYFPRSELKTFRQFGSILQGHPSTPKGTPGVEMSSGSLGHGLSFAIGEALSGRLKGKDYKTYCSISDAECQEGQTWEAAAVASHMKLGNLCGILDYNDAQIDGKVSDIMDVAPLKQKWQNFGWEVDEIDGHDYDEIKSAFVEFTKNYNEREKPYMIISHNVMGKGVSFMEGKPEWHHGALDEDQLSQALEELEEYIGK